MKNMLAFSGSNNSQSINHQLVEFVVRELGIEGTKIISLLQYEMPMYSEDYERKNGLPGMALALRQEISEATYLIISVNEHNGTLSAFFKNVIDWLSRVDRNFLAGKKILLMSTSPGQRGGTGALETCKQLLPRFGGEIIEHFSFPSFYANYDTESKQLTDEMILLGLREVLTTFAQQIN
ncbi:NADPH-dependent FMN reductase [Aquimarina hainanensis]|uniref:NADPH-dependent FMN reductase n=1 Tax=Aquimarina hainanensis TaxID=1578017 RepID=A0ABW5ND93_9FLAO|nr:NAD(P)H-dependent oxidoreductase [Aquimarina sp. TRL1]QKX07390.1 NAD(P)H-dependent oxidoreductase [Aquimarina sp. TRL1]